MSNKNDQSKFRPLDVSKSIKDNEEMYFGSNGMSIEAVVSKLCSAIVILGAKDLSLVNYKSWWIVASDLDWLNSVTEIPTQFEHLFSRLYAFSEAGLENCRPEIFLGVYCTNIVTLLDEETTIIKGDTRDEEIMKIMSQQKRKRVLAFDF